MRWIKVAPKNYDRALDEIRPFEWRNVSFSSRLVEDAPGLLPPTRRSLLYRFAGPPPRYALYTSTGLVFPLLCSDRADGDEGQPVDGGKFVAPTLAETARMTAEIAERFPVHSFMGSSPEIRGVLAASGMTMRTIDYLLMTNGNGNPKVGESALLPGLKIRPASPSDFEALYPLQEAYEKEEVLLQPQSHNVAASRKNFRRILDGQIVFCAEWNGRMVGKAGTNARGLEYDQIGGVFSAPEYRGMGIATRLMSGLLEHLTERKRRVCLFVKTSNSAARALYAGLGFEIRTDFQIGYAE